MSEQKHSYTFEDLIECAKGRLFGPGNAQLPLPPMLMFDRILKIDDTGGQFGKGEVVAELDIKPELYDSWLECLVKAARKYDADFSSEIEDAWRGALAPGIEHLRAGY